MFGYRKKIVLETGTTTVPIIHDSPKPITISIEAELTAVEHDEYVKISQELGFRPAALIKDELIGFLNKQSLKVYVFKEVKQYLDQKFGKKTFLDGWSHTWGWCPLREVDIDKTDLPDYSDSNTYHADNGEFTFQRPYHGAIPFSVLSLVKEISSHIPDLFFFVSDSMKPQDRLKRDPFLAVSTPGMLDVIVIAEWDEPSFRAKQSQ